MQINMSLCMFKKHANQAGNILKQKDKENR